MQIDGDSIILSTGKVINANRGIVGINPDLDISEGYDGTLDEEDLPDDERLTDDERLELANYVISLWEKWKSIRP